MTRLPCIEGYSVYGHDSGTNTTRNSFASCPVTAWHKSHPRDTASAALSATRAPVQQTRRGETVTGRPPGCESGGGSSPRGMHNTRWSRTGRLQAHASHMGDETSGCRWGLPAHHSSSEPRQISPFRGGPRRKHPALTRSVSPQNCGARGSQRRGRDGSVGSKRCRAAWMREREQSLLSRPPLRSSQSPFQRSLRLQSAEPAPATAQTQEGERRMLRSRRRRRPRRGDSGSEAAFSGAVGALCGSSGAGQFAISRLIE